MVNGRFTTSSSLPLRAAERKLAPRWIGCPTLLERYSLRKEGDIGFVVVYDDGLVLEFALAEPAELHGVSAGEAPVAVDDADQTTASLIAIAQNTAAQPGSSDPANEVRLAMVKVLLGWVGCDGEVRSARSWAGVELSMRASGVVDIGSGSLTQVSERTWRERPGGYRSWERSAQIGTGDEFWRSVAIELLRWGVKTRSGFTVDPDHRVSPGDRPVIYAHPLGFLIREPVEVVDVVDGDSRVGFAYRTLPGHPVSGEEAFIIEHAGDTVTLTIRSLTRASETWQWRVVYPLLLAAQAIVRRRYLRALREAAR